MNAIRYDFTPPHIVGALGDETLDPLFAKRCERMLRARGVNAACLSFCVAPRHLHNVIACMRLIDVVGLVVHASHSRRIVRFLPRIDAGARAFGTVDMVIRRGTGFIGTHTWARALMHLVGGRRGRPLIIGRGSEARAVADLLKRRRPLRIAAPAPVRSDAFPENAIVIDLREAPSAPSMRNAITRATIEKTAAHIRTDSIARLCRTPCRHSTGRLTHT